MKDFAGKTIIEFERTFSHKQLFLYQDLLRVNMKVNGKRVYLVKHPYQLLQLHPLLKVDF